MQLCWSFTDKNSDIFHSFRKALQTVFVFCPSLNKTQEKHSSDILLSSLNLPSFWLFIFCRHVGQPCRTKHFCASSTGSEHWPLAQTEETWSKETLSTLQTQTPVITVQTCKQSYCLQVIFEHQAMTAENKGTSLLKLIPRGSIVSCFYSQSLSCFMKWTTYLAFYHFKTHVNLPLVPSIPTDCKYKKGMSLLIHMNAF